MTGHNRRTKFGSVLAVALTAVMVLSVFAAPAAAATISEPNTKIVTADDVANGDYENDGDITVSDTIEFKSTAAPADAQVVFQLNNGKVNEGEIEITNAEITGATGFTAENVNIDLTNGDIYQTTKDTVILTLPTSSGDDISGNTVSFDLNYTISTAAADDAARYTDSANSQGATIIKVTKDDTSGTTNAVDHTTAPESDRQALDIQPGQPASLNLDYTNNRLNYDGATAETVTVTVDDAQGNQIQATSVSDSLGNDYDTALNYKAYLNDSSDTEVDNVTSAIDLANGAEQDTFNIDDAGTDGTDINDLVVGDDLTVSVTDDDADYDVSSAEDWLVIEPNQVYVNAVDTKQIYKATDDSESDMISADDGKTDFVVTFNDSGGAQISDDNIDSINVTFSGLSGGDGAVLNKSVENIENDDTVEISENKIGANVLLFEETDNQFDSSVSATVEPYGSDSFLAAGASDSASINVISGEPYKLDISDATTDVEQELANTGDDTLKNGPVTVQIQDYQGNVINDRDFGDTGVQVTLTGSQKIDSTEITISATDNGERDVHLGGNGDLAVAVGTFTFDAEQTVGDLQHTAASTDVTIYPKVTVQSGPSDTTAGNDGTITVALNDTAGNNITANGITIDNIDLKFAVKGDDLQTGVKEFSATMEGSSDNETTLTGLSQNEIKIGYNSETAGLFSIDVDAIPGSEGTSVNEGNSFTVDAAAYNESQTAVEVDKEFVGTIANDEDLKVSVQLRDEYGNYLDYDTATIGTVNLTLAETEFESDLYTDYNGETEANVEDADGYINVTYDTTLLAHDTAPGMDAVTLGVDTTEVASTNVELVHEAYALNDGFNRMSVPQPAKVVETDVNHVTTWNTSANNYDNNKVSIFTGETVKGDEELHSGLQVNADSANARVGFNFDTTSTASTGEVSLESGWNFVGTNYDIAETSNRDIAEDLLTVKEIDDNPNKNEIVKDGGLNKLLNASSSGSTTSDLQGVMADNNNGEFGTYWVYVEDAEGAEYIREIVKPSYDTNDRNTELGN